MTERDRGRQERERKIDRERKTGRERERDSGILPTRETQAYYPQEKTIYVRKTKKKKKKQYVQKIFFWRVLQLPHFDVTY